MQGFVSQETFRQQFHHLSDKPEEVVLFLSQNDIACWSRTYIHKARLNIATINGVYMTNVIMS